MATIKRFEDLECWQEARNLVNIVYAAINNCPDFQKDYRLVGQITGASVSVMNNIVEGWAAQSNADTGSVGRNTRILRIVISRQNQGSPLEYCNPNSTARPFVT